MIFFRSQVSRYVLLFEGRTGSTYLTDVLAQHPEILAEVEHLRLFAKDDHAAARQLDWARKFLTPPLLGPHRVVGFKTKLRDVVDLPALTALLHEKRVKVLFMQRRNRIKQTVSYFTGLRLNQTTQNWNLYQETDRPGALRIETKDFDAALALREAREQALADYVESLALPTLPLHYEDLLRDEAAFMAPIYAFLGVRPRTATPATKKNTSDDLRQVLLNFDELRAHYAGTPYAAMFDEVLVPTPAQPER